MRRGVLVLAFAVLAAGGVADARPIVMGDVVRSALDAVCVKVVTGGRRVDAIHDGFTKGWTDAGAGALAKSGKWGLVRVAVTAAGEKAVECRVTGLGRGGAETLSYADAWAGKHGLERQGEARSDGRAVEQSWWAESGLSMRARAVAGDGRRGEPDVEIVVARGG